MTKNGIKEHIGKVIEVEIGVFTSYLASSLTTVKKKGILIEYNEKSGYCRYSIEDIIQPIIHESSVKLIL